jgi:hypothetical protein
VRIGFVVEKTEGKRYHIEKIGLYGEENIRIDL